jgi:hypothetical protein
MACLPCKEGAFPALAVITTAHRLSGPVPQVHPAVQRET